MAAIVLMLIAPIIIGAQQAPASDSPGASSVDVVSVATAGALSRFLPDTLAGLKATTDVRQVSGDSITDLVGEKTAVYQEYLVTSAASRDYAGVRVDVFETRHQFAAFGLFTFNNGAAEAKSIEVDIGSGGARLNDDLIFWKANFFVHVSDANLRAGRGRTAIHEAIARAVANEMGGSGVATTRPPLLDSLPESVKGAGLVPKSQRYFLGPESLNAFVEHAREMFQFVGDTEAVIGEYAKADNVDVGASRARVPDEHSASLPAAQPLRLVIVECHTPEFASDELAHVTGYVSSLPEIEQQRIVFKRTGNYIVAAVNVPDPELAEGLINSVEYRYTVKWLRNPLWPTNDPFRSQKAAEMLLSTFGLLGLILLTVLIVGTVFGTTVFLKRRKEQREIFSDAGGMLRLDIEPFVLGLPPKRSEE